MAYFGDKGASQAVKVLTDPTVTEYLDAIHNGAKGDATTLDNMIEALKFIQEANQLRAKEGLQPLKVSDTLMAQAMADADYANNNVNHPLQFPASENLAWGYTDPFKGWYDTEKSMYEKDMSDGVLDCKASQARQTLRLWPLHHAGQPRFDPHRFRRQPERQHHGYRREHP